MGNATVPFRIALLVLVAALITLAVGLGAVSAIVAGVTFTGAS